MPENESDLKWIKEGLRISHYPFFIIGMGSNLLVSDDGLDAVVIKTTKVSTQILERGETLEVGSSVSVTSLLREAAKRGFSGFELLTGVPGSVGGVIYMNAGTHLGEAKDVLIATRSFRLKSEEDWVERTGKELKFDYRKNFFIQDDEVLFSSLWKFTRKEPAEVKAIIDETLARRKSSQPLEYPSCGSVFKNPLPRRAWEVIDSLGLRGKRIGNAAFSEKHPNFIVNLGQAKADDVWNLIALAKREAKERLGVELHEEVRMLGNFPSH